MIHSADLVIIEPALLAMTSMTQLCPAAATIHSAARTAVVKPLGTRSCLDSLG